jgi:hypothetical protein
VDTFGYSAIDFELLDFWPTHDRFRRGEDVREAFPFYEPGQPWDKLQIKCWRNGRPVDLVSTGGHDVLFEGRRVFPLRFILRHYPIRGQAHGERKVLVERRQRFAVERQRGWHRQYDGIEKGHSFLRDPATLISYDPGAVRLQLVLRHRPVEELEGQAAERERALGESRAHVVRLRDELEGRHRQVAELEAVLEARSRQVAELEAAVEAHGPAIARVHDEVTRRTQDLDRLRRELEAGNADLRRLGSELDSVRHLLEAVYASRSWRWTAPLRALQRLFLGS